MGRTRRSTPRRPDVHPVSGTGGPIRPIQKKPPEPTGRLCCYGICCHFGTACVNSHTAEELQFFQTREGLRLQLREMQLQVEAKKVEFKKQRLSSREPLKPLNSLLQASKEVPNSTSCTSAPTSTEAPVPSTKRAPKSSRSSQRKSTSKPVDGVSAASPDTMVTSRVTTSSVSKPQKPVVQAPITAAVKWPAIAETHRKCLHTLTRCESKCILKTAAHSPNFVGNFRVRLPVWGRSLPPSWFQEQPSSYDPAFVLQSDHIFHADFAMSYPGDYNLWVRHSTSHLWYPIWKQDGTVLVNRLPDQ